MSDADDQTGGSGDPNYNNPPAGGKEKSAESPSQKDQNDNDIMTDDDLPSGG
jgi:hypothetical protein